MLVRFVTIAFLAVSFSLGAPAHAPSELSLAALRAALDAHVRQDRFGSAQWGIQVVSLPSASVIFQLDSEKALKPASNAKLFTGALALDALGPTYQIRTSAYANSSPENGVLDGDLIIYGRGDPSFAARFDGVSATNLFGRLVKAIRNAGIQRVKGDLVGDSTFFSGPPFGTGWTWDDLQYYYGAEVSALSAQDNTIDLFIRPGDTPGTACRIAASPATDFVELINRTTTTAPRTPAVINIERPLGTSRAYITGSLPKGYGTWTDAVTVPNPTLWAITLLKQELERAGISISGQPRALTAGKMPATNPASLKEIAFTLSPPVSTLVEKMMKPSQNLYAQLLLLQVGSIRKGPSDGKLTTEDIGVRELKNFARRFGAAPDEMLLDDGSGLSRSTLVSARATVQLLQYMSKHRYADFFRASLPEAGTDGTLRTRLKDLKGRLWAKTGSLRSVSTLSGYVRTAAGEELAFSIFLNAYIPPPGKNERDEIDAILRLLARLNQRTALTSAQ